jgi:hypothetical protein
LLSQTADLSDDLVWLAASLYTTSEWDDTKAASVGAALYYGNVGRYEIPLVLREDQVPVHDGVSDFRFHIFKIPSVQSSQMLDERTRV